MDQTITMQTLITVCAVFVIPGVIAWIAVIVRIARLEERQTNHSDDKDELKCSIDKIFDKIEEINRRIKN